MSISVENITVEYASRRILNGIDLEIDAGEFVSIVGETGCGKSTLLRLILAEEHPTRGRVLVQGRERSRPDRTCGYVPQRYSLFPDKTVLDNVTFGLEVTSRGFLRRREFQTEALRYLRHTGLTEADAKKYPHQLSGGMQQRVAIAQALIMKPPVLLMDEAFSALDPATRRGMQRLMKDLSRESGMTVVFVTHNTREAVCLGTRVIALAKRDERGSSVALDLDVPHFDFDSDEEQLRRLIARVESSATFNGGANEAAALTLAGDGDASPVHTRTRA
jgi:NitT/TauT family transport system ATP-binding protein